MGEGGRAARWARRTPGPERKEGHKLTVVHEAFYADPGKTETGEREIYMLRWNRNCRKQIFGMREREAAAGQGGGEGWRVRTGRGSQGKGEEGMGRLGIVDDLETEPF